MVNLRVLLRGFFKSFGYHVENPITQGYHVEFSKLFFSSNSSHYFHLVNSTRVKHYKVLDIGITSEIRSIWKSTTLFASKPGKILKINIRVFPNNRGFLETQFCFIFTTRNKTHACIPISMLKHFNGLDNVNSLNRGHIIVLNQGLALSLNPNNLLLTKKIHTQNIS